MKVGDKILCNTDLYMSGTSNRCFTRGKFYIIKEFRDPIGKTNPIVTDDLNNLHSPGSWMIHFNNKNYIRLEKLKKL